MNRSRSARFAVCLVVISPVLTLTLWAWMLTRPAGTFNDQGGMLVSFIYFPAALLGWLLCGIPGMVLAIRSRRHMDASHKKLAGATIGLSIVGLLLAVATLFIA